MSPDHRSDTPGFLTRCGPLKKFDDSYKKSLMAHNIMKHNIMFFILPDCIILSLAFVVFGLVVLTLETGPAENHHSATFKSGRRRATTHSRRMHSYDITASSCIILSLAFVVFGLVVLTLETRLCYTLTSEYRSIFKTTRSQHIIDHKIFANDESIARHRT